MHPIEALELVYGEKAKEIQRNIAEYFKGVSTKVVVKDLLSTVNNARLEELLLDKTHLSLLELGKILGECAN